MGSNERRTPERKTEGLRILYICPKCGKRLTLRYRYRRNECAACGQAIDFEAIEKQWWTEWLVCQNREEALRCAEEYNRITKTDFFHPESFLNRDIKENKWWPKNLCFFFLKSQDYGRFMRWVAKDGPTRLIFAKKE